jgi:hypothetical protein
MLFQRVLSVTYHTRLVSASALVVRCGHAAAHGTTAQSVQTYVSFWLLTAVSSISSTECKTSSIRSSQQPAVTLNAQEMHRFAHYD